MTKALLIFLILSTVCELTAQQLEFYRAPEPVSLRGLSPVSNEIVWVSGSKGTVGRSVDGGKTWKWMVVPGFEKADFRDVEGFSASEAVLMAIAEPGYILKTTDGGETWKTVYENKTKGVFMDAMDFADDLNGVIVGDPIGGKYFITRTRDGGNTWTDEPAASAPLADSGSGCFASSGTNIRMFGDGTFIFAAEGVQTKVFYQGHFSAVPFSKGNGSTGANSIAVHRSKASERWVTVGGDFRVDTLRTNNCFISTDRGKTWVAPAMRPFGYRSCVEFLSADKLIACGLNGIDLSDDGGIHWRKFSGESFHTCRKAKKGSAVFLSGNKGRVAKIIF